MKFREQKIQILIDLFTINISTILLFFIKFHSGFFKTFSAHSYTDLIVIMPIFTIFWIGLFFMRNMYRTFYFRSSVEILLNLITASLIGNTIIYIITMNNFSQEFQKGRLATLFYFLFFTAIVGAGRVLFKLIQNFLHHKNIGLRNAVVIGCNETGDKLVSQYLKKMLLGIRIVGFVDKEKYIKKTKVPFLGNLDDLDEIIEKYKLKEIIIALDAKDDVYINDVIVKCKNHKINIKSVPSLNDIMSGFVRTSAILDYPLMELFPSLLTPFQNLLKRIIDIVCSILLLLFSFPIMLVTAIIIKLDSPGEIIYKQKRVGQDFKEFTVLKFRSMAKNAEAKTGAVWATKNDSRITKVGSFIRKTRIDELPQLFNVLAGQMSFVGPRPERMAFVKEFAQDIPYYYKRLHVKPGLTGWAQVKHKYDESFDDVKEKLKFDLFYIENMSIQLDFIIILNTVWVVISGKGQ